MTEHSHSEEGGGTRFTNKGATPRAGGAKGLGMPGGESWVESWLEP